MFRRLFCTTALLLTLSLPTWAATNPLSVHVLDQVSGQPAPGIAVVLEQQQGQSWKTLNQGTTDAQGRIKGLFPEKQTLSPGIYRVTFKTGAFFRAQGTATFFPEIPVLFEVSNPAQHYHIPLLLSPFGYATYRGN